MSWGTNWLLPSSADIQVEGKGGSLSSTPPLDRAVSAEWFKTWCTVPLENNTQFHVNLIRYAIVQDNWKRRQCDLIFASIRLGSSSIRLGSFPIDKHISGLEVKMNMLILGDKTDQKIHLFERNYLKDINALQEDYVLHY